MMLAKKLPLAAGCWCGKNPAASCPISTWPSVDEGLPAGTVCHCGWVTETFWCGWCGGRGPILHICQGLCYSGQHQGDNPDQWWVLMLLCYWLSGCCHVCHLPTEDFHCSLLSIVRNSDSLLHIMFIFKIFLKRTIALHSSYVQRSFPLQLTFILSL